MNLKDYEINGFFDELLTEKLSARTGAGKLIRYIKKLKPQELQQRKDAAELAIMAMGITFTVYSEGNNIDRDWPYDIIPRIIPQREWQKIEAGLEQRLTALNHFIDDIYNDKKIIKDKVVPGEILKSSKNYRKECIGVKPVFGAWAHICGSDLIRGDDGTMYVLEDNLRVPSGVSYMLENRKVTKRVFPELFEDYNILPMGDYPTNLFDTLSSISPRPMDYPEVVVLTPGIYNSAYFEHSFLAQQMGAELVEGSDLVVAEDDCVYMKTTEGLSRVDVIYRRIDDLFLDPEVFDKKSVLGVPGLMRAWKKGNVALANAPGAGVADDKVVYTYVPDMIRYYLDQDPIIPNVPSYSCDDVKQRKHVLANLDKLVVKPANESGGYGMLIGPHSSKKEQSEMAKNIKANPRNYIAQPVINLSTVPTLSGKNIEPRHVDLRPFTLQSDRTYVTSGGLTRVALVKGSLVVNSSQGGGSKDTWIVAPDKG
tara:strand:+ start:1785 stop:3230 length:1446 start_codon:yes stop_codon:yes gene_type:complete